MVDVSRKGAIRVSEVPKDVLNCLNTGQIEAVNLTENLATDFVVLLNTVLPEIDDTALGQSEKLGVTKRMALVAELIFDYYGLTKLEFLASHQSDLVRGWGAYLVAHEPNIPLEERLVRIRGFADDAHFGVREWSWLAVRPHIVKSPEQAIACLTPWVRKESEFLRRFAVEAIRPRGVWSKHIAVLKTDPSLAIDLLSPVKQDESRYVQDSVANWLNDAWKSSPTWVEGLCSKWLAEGRNNQATDYIIKRALRNKK